MRRLLVVFLAACNGAPASAPSPAPARKAQPAPATPPAPAPMPAFTGSEACLRCHGKKGAGFHGDWHARALAPATAANAVAPFRGTHFAGGSTEAWMVTAGDHYAVRTADAAGKLEELRVDWLIGGKRMQDPVTVLPDGRWQVLPVYYHVTGHEWVDYTEDKQGRLGPDHPFFWENFRRTANHECLDCHATGVEVAYDAAAHRWSTRMAEPGVGCEACHGPGARHAETQEAADIVHPGKLPRERALAVCAQCHGPRRPLYPILDAAHRFRPGGDYDASYTALVIVDGALRSNDFFADGRPRTSSYEHQALAQSRCHLGGGASCLDCHAAPHDAHLGDELRARPDETCRPCHAPVFAAGRAHTHHARAACVDCHMPRIVTGVLDAFADHALDVPAPANTARHGVPTPCTACADHAAEKPEVTAAALARLWPAAAARQGRRARLADAIDEKTAAGSEPALAAVVADESEAPTLRGAAAVLLAQRFPAAAAALLVPLAGHPSALVRARVAEALGYTRDRAAGDALVAAAGDRALAVRDAAVAALAQLGDPRAEDAARRLIADPAGDALPGPHYVLAMFRAFAGDVDGADRELARVLALVPYHADALVARAGLAMRAGDRERARAFLREALSFAPDHREARARLEGLDRP